MKTLIEILSGIETMDRNGNTFSVPITESTHKEGVEFETEHEVPVPSMEIVPDGRDNWFNVYARTTEHTEMYQIMEELIMRLRGTNYRFGGTKANLSKAAVVFCFDVQRENDG